MTIVQVDPRIRAFLNEDESINNFQRDQIRKTFQTTITELFEYGALEFGQGYDLKLTPTTFQAVRPTKRPLIPMVISLIPPDEFPSGEFRTTRVPSPQDVPLRLVRTTRNGGAQTGRQVNVETVREIASIVPDQNGFLVTAVPFTTTLSFSFRTDVNTLAQARIPVQFTSSNPEVLEVDEAGVVTVNEIPLQGESVTISGFTQEGQPLNATVLFTASPIFTPEQAPPPTPIEEVSDNAIETRVAVNADTLGTEFLESQEQRYRTLLTQGQRSDVELEDNLEVITERRQRIVDIFAEESQSIQQQRTIGANEDFIRRQVQVFKALPPLVMYINPESFSVSYSHMVSDGNRGRDGYIIEHWGLEQPTISASGKIGAAYISTVGTNGQAAGGLTRKLRRGSAAYQKFMSLYQSYRNNSYIYNNDGRIALMGSVKIFYGEKVYTGTFDSFSINETEDSPFSLQYSFDFTVRFEDHIFEDT